MLGSFGFLRGPHVPSCSFHAQAHAKTNPRLLCHAQTEEARAEAATLMASTANLCTPKNGDIMIAATQVGV